MVEHRSIGGQKGQNNEIVGGQLYKVAKERPRTLYQGFARYKFELKEKKNMHAPQKYVIKHNLYKNLSL